MDIPDLGALLTDLSASCVATQRILNAQLEVERDRFQATVQHLPIETVDIYRCLIPAQQLIRTCDIEASISVSVANRAGFQIEARPLNVLFSVIHKTKRERETRIHLTIEQVPAILKQKEKCNVG